MGIDWFSHLEAVSSRFSVLIFSMALTKQALADLRQDYSLRGLEISQLALDPIVQFQSWLSDAHAEGLIEPNAMILATVDPMGQPWTRTVLLKGCDPRGFSFFTNYDGRKAQHLSSNAKASLTFWWSALERQVNISGLVLKVDREESEAYFTSRPVASQLGAWASFQSSVLESREALEDAFDAQRRRFDGQPIPCPEHWGGFRVVPETIEFWQGRRSRLHDRFFYSRSGPDWMVQRLAP